MLKIGNIESYVYILDANVHDYFVFSQFSKVKIFFKFYLLQIEIYYYTISSNRYNPIQNKNFKQLPIFHVCFEKYSIMCSSLLVSKLFIYNFKQYSLESSEIWYIEYKIFAKSLELLNTNTIIVYLYFLDYKNDNILLIFKSQLIKFSNNESNIISAFIPNKYVIL